MSRKLVNVFQNREMRFGFLVLCFALMGHRRFRCDIHFSCLADIHVYKNSMFLICSLLLMVFVIFHSVHHLHITALCGTSRAINHNHTCIQQTL
jgi:hypothetical protein